VVKEQKKETKEDTPILKEEVSIAAIVEVNVLNKKEIDSRSKSTPELIKVLMVIIIISIFAIASIAITDLILNINIVSIKMFNFI